MKKRDSLVLLVVTCIIATCGLVYELSAGTLASYLLGDSVKQFSIIIGLYLFSMGIGAYVSKFIRKDLLDRFIQIEFLVGIVGGLSSLLLMLLFNYAEHFVPLLYLLISITGILVGIEIPILMRLLKHHLDFEQLVSRVLTFDYLGALLASVLFPMLCIPYLGLSRTSLFFGFMNVATGLIATFLFKPSVRWFKHHLTFGILCGLALIGLFIYSEKLTNFLEEQSFPGKIIHAESTPYQRIVVTRNENDIRLYLNNNLQFSSIDEHRYHEALVHPAAQGSKQLESVLILGGGDGLAAREMLKYSSIKKITLVDLDPAMTHLFSHHKLLQQINHESFLNNKMQVIQGDAFSWLRSHDQKFDCLIVDLPDPSNYAISKLYTQSFYKELQKHFNSGACAVIQCTSPFAAPQSFWTIDTTIRSAGLNTIPYMNTVPSFGIWGYIVCTHENNYQIHRSLPTGLRFYTEDQFKLMRTFSPDMLAHRPLEINRLSNQVLVPLFEDEWSKFIN